MEGGYEEYEASGGDVVSGADEEEEEMLLDTPEEGGGDAGIGNGEGWRWGGFMIGEGGEVPLCKHLLACVLAERWAVAGGMVEEREVGRGEMAGWGGGWGG